MELNSEYQDGLTVVTVQCDALDAACAGEFRALIAAHVDADVHLLVDLEHVGFIDSSGLGALLSVMRQLETGSGRLHICSAKPPVKALFELVRFHRIVDIYNSREEAVGALQK